MFFKGFICGIGIIIPGFSFSTIAILINIYDDLLFSINNIFKKPKESLKKLIPFFLGAICSSIVLFYPVNFALKTYPLLLIMFFTGLLIGGFIPLLKKVENKDLFITFICFIAFLLVESLINNFTVADLFINNFYNSISLIIVSLLCAFAALAPSLSITFILLSFGLYPQFIDLLSQCLIFNFNNLFNSNLLINLLILTLSFIGFLLIFSHVISYVLKKYNSKTLAFFIGASLSSLINTFLSPEINILPFKQNTNLCYYYSISIICLILGILIIVKIESKMKE